MDALPITVVEIEPFVHRVIYYYHNLDLPLFLLTVFAKSKQANLSQQERNELKQLTAILVKEYQTKKRKKR